MLIAFGMVYMGILHLRHAYAVVLGKHVCKFTSSVFAVNSFPCSVVCREASLYTVCSLR